MNIESPFTSVFVYLLACVYSDNQYSGSILLNSQRIVLQKEVETIEKNLVCCVVSQLKNILLKLPFSNISILEKKLSTLHYSDWLSILSFRLLIHISPKIVLFLILFSLGLAQVLDKGHLVNPHKNTFELEMVTCDRFISIFW